MIYDPLAIEDVEKQLQDKIDTLNSVLMIGKDACALLLLSYSWNETRLQDLYTSQEQEKIRLSAGLPSEPPRPNDPKFAGPLVRDANEDFMCFICCSEGEPDMKTFHCRYCDHLYCTECYARYIRDQLKMKKTMIRCPDSSCKLNLGLSEIQELSEYLEAEEKKEEEIEKAKQTGVLTSDEIAKRFQQEEYDPDYQEYDDMESIVQQREEEDKVFHFDERINERIKKEKIDRRQSTLIFHYWYVIASHYCNTNSKVFKFCPFPDCDSIIKLKGFDSDEVASVKELADKLLVPTVKCHENHSFCYNCMEEDHAPIPCKMCKGWLEKCKGESETAKWITVNTKVCPKCESSIEKNGGCNHMTCGSCRYEFCWKSTD
ncbi:unnamed protein product [Ambrosiozyma monospora]|uniref:Unnamed protein product n=1 Tax=Ambrosiozyma monospora TaxID=43982 RepID=A0ACB5TT81_AMBMO|nr:unnamed protein product [Ambrosiozyma monospora]